MADEIARLGIEVNTKDIKTAITRLDRLEKEAGQTEKATKKMTRSFSGLGTAIGAIGLGLFTKSVITANAEFSKLSGALETVTGSTAAADEALTMLKGLMVEVPGSLNELTTSFIKLTALGLDPSEEALISYSNTAAAMGHSLNQMIEAVADAATGEFERLKEFGIKAASEGDRVAFTFQGVTTEIGKNAEEIQDYLLGIGNVQFADAAADQMNTFGGAIDNLQSQFSLLLIGDKGTLNDATEQLKDLSNLVGSEETQKAFGRLTASIISLVGLAAKGAVAFVDFGESIGVVAAQATGAYIKDIARLEAEVSTISGSLDTATKSQEKYNAALAAGEKENWFGFAGGVRDQSEEIEKLTAKLALAKAALEEIQPKEKAAVSEAESTALDEEEKPVISGELITEAAFEESLAFLEMQNEALRIDKEEKLAIEMDYYDRLYDMQTGSQQAALDFTEAVRSRDLKGAISSGALALSNVSKQSRAMFNVQKALALANAVVTLPSAIVKSFDNAGGYPWGLIPAGLMAAQGAAQIASISSASFGGGGGGASVGGGGTAPALPPGATATPTGLEEGVETVTKQINLTVEGDGPHSESMRQLANDLAETISDMGGNVAVVVS